MNSRSSIHRSLVAALMLGVSSIAVAPMTASAQNYAGAAQRLSPREIDSLTAPIALYSDQLLADFLMAASYPDEVQEAAQWLAEPRNTSLRGDALAQALDSVDWDPSVKALTMVPGILQMMDNQIDWTARLGDAFVNQRDDVMDSVQRLRREAYANGRLRSSARQRVVVTESEIQIEPVSSDSLYFPVYNPVDMYGPWPYPDYPPVYLAPPVGYGLVTGYDYGVVVPIFTPFWGWNRWDWRHHRVRIDPGRFDHIDHNHHAVGTTWQHDPSHDSRVNIQGSGQGQRAWSGRNGAGRSGSAPANDFRSRRGPITITGGQPPATSEPTGQSSGQEDRRFGRQNRGVNANAAPAVATPAPTATPPAHQPSFRERGFTAPPQAPAGEPRESSGEGRSFRERGFTAPPPASAPAVPSEAARVPPVRIPAAPVPAAQVPMTQPPAFAGNGGGRFGGGGGYHAPAPPPVITAAPVPASPPPAASAPQGQGQGQGNPNNPNGRYGRNPD